MPDEQKPLSPAAHSAWEQLSNERNVLWRKAEDKLDRVRQLLEFHGCSCDCDHSHEEHNEDCDRCCERSTPTWCVDHPRTRWPEQPRTNSMRRIASP